MTGPSFWFLGLLAESTLAYLFWANFYILVYTVWWMPMSIMTVTEGGTEFIFLVSHFSGLLLGIDKLRWLLHRFQGFAFLLTLVGIPSYFASDVFLRLTYTVAHI
eukprot:TRINITY_DN2928_c0_g3_i14.p1 TRINITY_DN2928_c0_g3~~TRINITY_DN2928_c0_g3_i14.p1  ORF type:complete len:105 (+),score=10.25 TRINITY_DN2928_c0_g3_i14:80-394(+)